MRAATSSLLLILASTLAGPLWAAERAGRDKLVVGMIRCNTSTGRVNDRALKGFCEVLAKRPDLDLLLAPEWFLVPKEGLHKPGEYRAIRRHLERKTAGRETLVVPGSVAWAGEKNHRNTALAIADGKTLAAYSKKHVGGDNWYAHAYGKTWVPGKRSGVFSWNGRRVGLEICADHHAGALRAAAGDTLDLQIVVSNGAGLFRESAAVKPGGYMLLCDGRAATAQAVKQRTPAGLVDVAPKGLPTKVGPFELVEFELPLAAPRR